MENTELKPQKADHSQIIDNLGGNQAVGNLCVRPRCGRPIQAAVVSGWRSRGIPDGWFAYLKVVRPEVFTQA